MRSDIGFKERRYIEELRIASKSTAVDCIIDDSFDRIIYVIKKGDMGLAIGKDGANIKRLTKTLGKRIEMVEEGEDLKSFVENIFKPAQIHSAKADEESGKVNVYLSERGSLGIAIGKNGCNVAKATLLLQRYFGMDMGGVLLLNESEKAE